MKRDNAACRHCAGSQPEHGPPGKQQSIRTTHALAGAARASLQLPSSCMIVIGQDHASSSYSTVDALLASCLLSFLSCDLANVEPTLCVVCRCCISSCLSGAADLFVLTLTLSIMLACCLILVRVAHAVLLSETAIHFRVSLSVATPTPGCPAPLALP